MTNKTVRLDRATLALFLVLLLTLNAGSESITMTTYMPSPSGNFKKLRVTEDASLAITRGHVGIGATGANPYSALHVVAPTSANQFSLTLENSHTVGSEIRLQALAAGGRQFRITSTANGASQGGGRFIIGDNTLPGGASADRLTIDSAGNVGIGTVSPAQRLHVNGGMQVGEIRTNGTRMTITGHDGGTSRHFWFRTGTAEPGSVFLGIRVDGTGDDGDARYVRILKPLLLPILTTVLRNAITGLSLEEGLLIYNSTTKKLNYRTDTAWREVGDTDSQARWTPITYPSPPTRWRLPGGVNGDSSTFGFYAIPGPPTIPTTAKEVLVYVMFRNGNFASIVELEYEIYTEEGGTQYKNKLTAMLYPNQSWVTQSINIWLPITPARRINVQLSGVASGNRDSKIEILGYR